MIRPEDIRLEEHLVKFFDDLEAEPEPRTFAIFETAEEAQAYSAGVASKDPAWVELDERVFYELHHHAGERVSCYYEVPACDEWEAGHEADFFILEPVQTQLEPIWLYKDGDEVWHTYCRDHAIKVGEELGLLLALDPLRQTTVKPEYFITPEDRLKPDDEVYEPEVFEALPYEADSPQACEDPDCGLWLECELTKDGIRYLTDEGNNFEPEVIELYLGKGWKLEDYGLEP